MKVHPETLIVLKAIGGGASAPELTERLGLHPSLEPAVVACAEDLMLQGLLQTEPFLCLTDHGRALLRVHGF